MHSYFPSKLSLRSTLSTLWGHYGGVRGAGKGLRIKRKTGRLQVSKFKSDHRVILNGCPCSGDFWQGKKKERKTSCRIVKHESVHNLLQAEIGDRPKASQHGQHCPWLRHPCLALTPRSTPVFLDYFQINNLHRQSVTWLLSCGLNLKGKLLDLKRCVLKPNFF